jgi:diphthamide biosynthesis protein 7
VRVPAAVVDDDGSMAPPNISSAFSTVLDQPPSCLEFSPVATALFVVGTYCLEEQRERGAAVGEDAPGDLVERGDKVDDGLPVPQSRSGSLVLYALIDDSLQA